jgi:hypothetical protein
MKKINCHTCKKRGHMVKNYWFQKKHQRCFNCGKYNHKRSECLKSRQFGAGNFNLQNNRIKRDHEINQIGNLPK